jgi:cAMP phosphodiesterase
MQGIAKSVNTAYALKNLVQLHMDLVNMLETFMSNQQSINDTLATHAHIDPVSGTTGPEMPDAMVANIWDTINTLVLCELMIDKHKLNCTNYLDNHTEENKGSWIGSRFNYTN